MKIGRGVVAFLGTMGALVLPSCQRSVLPAATTGRAPAAALAAGAIRRTLLASRPATGLADWETRIYLIEYGPGAVAPLHVHPVVGLGQVLEGSFESASGDEPPTQVHAGQAFVDPAGVPHRLFRNVAADAPLRFVVAYTIRTGEPIFYPGPSLPPSRTEAL